jgi:hypothetical protein
MRKRHAALALLALTALLPSSAWSQAPEVSVRMSASPTRLRVGELLSLEVRAEAEGGQVDDVELPDLREFEVVAHQVAQPLHFQFGGGRSSIRSTVVHQFRLRALEPGAIRIAPTTVSVAGEAFASNQLTIEVTGAAAIDPISGKPPTTDSTPPPLDSNAPSVDGAVFDPDVFLRTVVDKRDPYVGEQVTVTVYLYTTVGGQPQLSREPTTDGFWVHDLLGPSRPNRPERQMVHGIPFRVYVLRRVAAFPLRTGELRIGAPELRLEQTSVFGMMRGRGAALERLGVPITLDVKPLPDPAPPGAVVGNYTMEAAVDRTSASVGDAVTLTVNVRGTGNLNDVRVSVPSIPGVRVLEPEIDDRLSSTSDLVGGERSMRFLLIAEAPGDVTIPALTLPYFDPQTRTYGATETAPMTLTITGAAATSAGAAVDSTGAQAGEATDAAQTPETLDLAPVHPRTELRRALDARGVPEDLGGRIIEELEGCDFARFSAAGSAAGEMERCRQRVEALLDRLQAFRPLEPNGAST